VEAELLSAGSAGSWTLEVEGVHAGMIGVSILLKMDKGRKLGESSMTSEA
jgi:hypothetical protein